MNLLKRSSARYPLKRRVGSHHQDKCFSGWEFWGGCQRDALRDTFLR